MPIFILYFLSLIAIYDPFFSGNINTQYRSANDSVIIVEKVFLHTDRDYYYPDDDIWFKAYLVEASERLLSNHSNNLHVELISPELQIIDSRTVKLIDGLGNGDFHVPEKLQSGRYILRAYTNYMRNSGDQLFFKKNITIINPTDASETFCDSSKFNKSKPEINFFPEGGSLVDNVPSVVAFKAENDAGAGINIAGEVYSSKGEVVTAFASTHGGMGKFAFTPVQGLKYYALIKSQDSDLAKYTIPESFSTGVVLNVSGNQAGGLLLTFKTNAETLPLILDHDLLLTVSARNIAFKTYSFRMKSLNSFLNIPTDDLPDGIIMVTLTGSDAIPLCERMIFLQNLEDVRVKIETDKTVYKQRDSVSLKVSLTVNSRTPQDAFLSLSASEKTFTDDSSGFPSTISSWFLLESDVRGEVENPSYYFDQSNPDRIKDMDLLLLTQGWRDFKWKYENIKYLPEHGFTVSGRIRKKFINTTVKNSVVNIGIFSGSKPFIFIVPVDSLGKFSFGGIDITGPVKIVATITDNKDNPKGWLFIDSLRYVPESVKSGMAPFPNSSGNHEQRTMLSSDNLSMNRNLQYFIQYSEYQLSVQRKYRLSDTIMPGEVMITAKRQDAITSPRERSRRYLMGTPDKEVEITPILSQIYPTTYMLIKNRYCSPFHMIGIPGLVRGEDLDPRMHNPMFLIDGSFASREDVEALPLKWVKRIDIMDNPNSWSPWANRMRMSESDTTNGSVDGVVSIILKDESEIEHVLPSYSSRINFSGYNQPRVFYSPKHTTTLEKDYKPDLRTTLFWDPDILVENNKDIILNYFNADNPSKIKIVVEGITKTGIPVTGKAEYEVK